MMERLRERDVPEGMVARCPWGTALKRWSDDMLARGLDECHTPPQSPVLAAAIRTEQVRRG